MKDLCFKTFPVLANMVLKEHERQIAKWGVQDHRPFTWLGYTLEELGEVSKAISEHKHRGGPASDVVKEAIQAGTLCLKIAEMYMKAEVEDRLKDVQK